MLRSNIDVGYVRSINWLNLGEQLEAIKEYSEVNKLNLVKIFIDNKNVLNTDRQGLEEMLNFLMTI